MRKAQMEKEFKQLYIGEDPAALTEKYYRKKRKEMLVLAAVFSGILLCGAVMDHENSQIRDNGLLRNENGDGKQEVVLELKINEEEWREIPFSLEEKSYTEKELEQLYDSALEALEQEIKKENQSLNEVREDLDLKRQLEGYPFMLTWDSSRPDIIAESGVVDLEQLKKAETVVLTVHFTYEEWERESRIEVTVCPEKTEDTLASLQESLRKREEETREEEIYYLPDTYGENELQWRYQTSSSSYVLGLLFLILLPCISHQKDKKIYKETEIRRQELLFSFPEFISKLILFTEAGMSMKSSLFRIAEDYQRKRKQKARKMYLYEELLFICRQMKNGLSEKEAYELLAERCNLPCYKKLAGLLIQHLQKGSVTILESLRMEAQKANDEQKWMIQKKGEEMGTKLLFPMMIMLGMVMVFIMVPALFSFQI